MRMRNYNYQYLLNAISSLEKSREDLLFVDEDLHADEKHKNKIAILVSRIHSIEKEIEILAKRFQDRQIIEGRFCLNSDNNL